RRRHERPPRPRPPDTKAMITTVAMTMIATRTPTTAARTSTASSRGRTMTERRPAPPRARPSLVYGSAIAAFVLAGAGLSAQLASGNDPSIGQGAQPDPGRTVHHVETKVIVTTVVRHKSPERSASLRSSSAP